MSEAGRGGLQAGLTDSAAEATRSPDLSMTAHRTGCPAARPTRLANLTGPEGCPLGGRVKDRMLESAQHVKRLVFCV